MEKKSETNYSPSPIYYELLFPFEHLRLCLFHISLICAASFITAAILLNTFLLFYVGYRNVSFSTNVPFIAFDYLWSFINVLRNSSPVFL